MIEARLALPGQSTPGPDAYRTCRQRERKRIIGQRGAPPYEGDLRLQRSIGREPTEGHLSGPQRRTAIRSIWVLSPPRRHPGASRPGAHPPAPPFRLRPPGAAQLPHPPHLPVSGLHTSADPTGATEFPDLEPCCGRAPTRSRRSYRQGGSVVQSVGLCRFNAARPCGQLWWFRICCRRCSEPPSPSPGSAWRCTSFHSPCSRR
jgi:hypothetical protein